MSMGIYIKNIEMPTKLDPDNYIELACGMDGKQYARLYNIYYGGLGGWSEVIPVTEPHGRLIDADELARDLNEDIENDQLALDVMDFIGKEREHMQFDKDCKQNCLQYLSEAPTIIPAEPPKEEI